VESRHSHSLRGSWKLRPNAGNKHRRLVLVWHRLVHDRTIPVTLDVRSQSLVRVTPSHFTGSLGFYAPVRDTLEKIQRPLCIVPT